MSCPRCPEGVVNSYSESVREPAACGHTHEYVIEHNDCIDCDHYWTEILSASICWCGWKPEGISTPVVVTSNHGDDYSDGLAPINNLIMENSRLKHIISLQEKMIETGTKRAQTIQLNPHVFKQHLTPTKRR